jgi:hypothetical protein
MARNHELSSGKHTLEGLLNNDAYLHGIVAFDHFVSDGLYDIDRFTIPDLLQRITSREGAGVEGTEFDVVRSDEFSLGVAVRAYEYNRSKQ